MALFLSHLIMWEILSGEFLKDQIEFQVELLKDQHAIWMCGSYQVAYQTFTQS